jgi:hypothetical protein
MRRAHGVGDRRADEARHDRVYPPSPDEETVRHRAQIGDVRRRFRMLVELLADRHGAAIGSPDWHGTRSASTQSVHWFYDWAPRGSGAARSAW